MKISMIKFPIYGTIIIISIFIGMYYIYKSLREEGYKDKNILLYFLLYIVFSFVFGMMFSAFTNPKAKSLFTAGLSSYGGLLGVIISAIIFELILPLDKKLIKYSIISLPLVYGLSKIACFLVGCCYGIPYKGIFYVIYPDGLNIKQFPIQIVETITFLIIFFILNKLRNNKYIIYITIISCALLKFLLDFLRYEHIKKIISTNQIFSVILISITIILLIYKKVSNKI